MATLPVENAPRTLAEASSTTAVSAERAPAMPSTSPVRVRRSPRPAATDELAIARRRKAHERSTVARYVDERLDAMECEEIYSVPVLYVAVAGSLAPAHLLFLVAKWSERTYADTGSGWVRQPVQTWVNFSGLAENDWMAARETLRERGLIEERRGFDLVEHEIVTEIAFVPSVFAAEVARVRDELRNDAWQRLRDGQGL
ncbi:conserved hypothetical protein [Rubrivivax sp. A210]|uniref:hypothetical protein n=1 Tax=Rubrivivax sp. A210 TaxID=2772301 RepID=UPI00191A4288|nr:hypothetical protein [Rubrivivax sp. A210]CAD5366550.1 conserved hypothetical protein [Rubrivivax sp. A210]